MCPGTADTVPAVRVAVLVLGLVGLVVNIGAGVCLFMTPLREGARLTRPMNG
jgi:hypothetical protein